MLFIITIIIIIILQIQHLFIHNFQEIASAFLIDILIFEPNFNQVILFKNLEFKLGLKTLNIMGILSK